MRELHSFSDERSARRLADVLVAHSLPVQVDEEGADWVVWIQNDDDRDAARDLLARFLANPQASEFDGADVAAQRKRMEAEQAERDRRKLRVNIQDRWAGVWYRCFPATMILIGICVFVAAVCTDWKAGQSSGLFGLMTCNDEQSELRNALFIQAPEMFLVFEGREYAHFGDPDLPGTLRRGQLWRPFTPMLLHFGVLHLLFNMIWLNNLGRWIEYIRGTRRFLVLVLVCSGISNIAQLYWSGPSFGGMSGVVFGLIGYAWMRGKTQPHQGIGLSPNQVVYSVLWMLLCMSGGLGPIANAAHLAGMATGMVIGARQTIWRKLRFQ